MGRQVTQRFLAYSAVYVLWGASFLAVRELVLVAPPFLMAGARFTIAGLILIVWSRIIRAPWPSLSEVRSTALLGLIMFAINYGCLFWAEQSVASGYAAIISSTIPVWIFLGEWLWLRVLQPNALSMTGIALGLAGVILLVLPQGGEIRVTLPACALLLGGLCWSAGTIWSRRLPMPKSRHASAGLQMGIGGLCLLCCSGAAGEFSRVPAMLQRWTPRLTLDLAYLIVFASIAAFFAFVWLIDHEPASRVTSHAYVNPLIAVVLGAWIAAERLSPVQLAGGALAISGVVVTLVAKRSLVTTEFAAVRRG